MNIYQLNGRIEEIKGTVIEEMGKLFDDKTMELKGKIQKHAGRARATSNYLKDYKKMANQNSAFF